MALAKGGALQNLFLRYTRSLLNQMTSGLLSKFGVLPPVAGDGREAVLSAAASHVDSMCGNRQTREDVVLLPSVQADFSAQGIWAGICCSVSTKP